METNARPAKKLDGGGQPGRRLPKRRLPSKRPLCFVVLLLCRLELPAQTANGLSPWDREAFPPWALDLRRGEVIAFGSFPIALLLSSLIIAPATEEEFSLSIGTAALAAVLVAVADHIIIRVRRNRASRQAPPPPEFIRHIQEEPPELPPDSGDAGAEDENMAASGGGRVVRYSFSWN
jgi:hypothetical protein